jgi:hypothetical protein
MTQTYDKQPEALPPTLPKGTRSTCESVSATQLELRKDSSSDGKDAYWGVWDDDGPTDISYFRAHAIDWTSVPLPAAPPAHLPDAGALTTLPVGTRYRCSSGEYELLEPVTRQPAGNRPWSGKYLTPRRRRMSNGEVIEANSAGWIPSESVLTLPTETPKLCEPEETSMAVCASCAEGDPRLGEQRCGLLGGKWYCLDTCLPEARDRQPLADVRIGTHCPECATKLDSGNVGNMPLCVGCTERRAAASASTSQTTRCSECKAPAAVLTGERCLYCAHALNGASKISAFSPRYDRRETSHAQVALYMQRNGTPESTERLAVMARAERPRGNPKERAELAKPHPWECDE